MKSQGPKDLDDEPVGTTHYDVKHNPLAFQAWRTFKATHYEKTPHGVTVTKFYGPTQAAAFEKAGEYDRLLKERTPCQI